MIDRNLFVENLKTITGLVGVSGYENAVRDYIVKEITPYVDTVWVDPLGSVLAIQEGTNKNERIMLDAHIDEVGFMVKYIDEKGFLKFTTIGGFDERILPAKAVTLLTAEGKIIHGVIGAKPPHLLKEEERKKPVDINDMYIDVGVSSRKEAEALGLTVGVTGVLYDPFVEMEGATVRAKALDDRAGALVLLELAKEFKTAKHDATLLYSFTAQEEVGLRGAGPSAFSLAPTMAIAVETTVAGDIPGIDEANCPSIQGNGPAITITDRSLIASQSVNKRIIENATAEKIPYQFRLPTPGGTNAGAIHQTREGVPSSVVAIPCRFIHSSVSTMKIDDALNAFRIVRAYITNNAKSSL